MLEALRAIEFTARTIQLMSAWSSQIAQLQTSFNMLTCVLAPSLEMKRLTSLGERIERFTSTIDKGAQELGSWGWTIPMEAPIEDCIWLLEQSTDYAAADKAFTEYYTADNYCRLRALENKLLSCKALEPWRARLDEAIRDVADDRLISCIAVLIPLIEGITEKRFSEAKFSKARGRNKFFSDRLKKVEPGSTDQYRWRAYKGFIAEFFKPYSSEESSNPPPALNRHWFSHGRTINPNLSDCLRLLQALDTISELE